MDAGGPVNCAEHDTTHCFMELAPLPYELLEKSACVS
jgi:hypothetical protein